MEVTRGRLIILLGYLGDVKRRLNRGCWVLPGLFGLCLGVAVIVA